jgi:2-C-methyl-D-erythritol 4-phosphate cytidylyltransferase
MDLESTGPVVAVVVAAGAGLRLGGGTPKALREVAGRSLVRYSLDNLAKGGVDRAVVVIATGEQAAFETALADSPIPAGYVYGGTRRQDSVRAGLTAIAGDPAAAGCEYVLIHDAARALVPPSVVAAVIEALLDGSVGCVPAVPMVDSIRQISGGGVSQVVDRSMLRAVQTPQGFQRSVLADALAQAERDHLEVTDDATAVEALGHQITLVPGSREAMKVTEPIDLVLAEAIVRSRG